MLAGRRVGPAKQESLDIEIRKANSLSKRLVFNPEGNSGVPLNLIGYWWRSARRGERTGQYSREALDSILTIAAEKDNEMSIKFFRLDGCSGIYPAVVSAGSGSSRRSARPHPGEEMDSAPHTGRPADRRESWSNATIYALGTAKGARRQRVFYRTGSARLTKRESFVRAIGLFGAAPAAADVNGAYNEFWFDAEQRSCHQTNVSWWWIQPIGRVPPLTPEAQKAAAVRDENSATPARRP